jgi:modulator of FtsH protease HflC
MNRALTLMLAVVVLLVLGFMITCVYTVPQTQQVALVEFGTPIAVVTEPGLHLKSPLQRAFFFDRRLLSLDGQGDEIITLDRKRVVVEAFARWRIVNPFLFQAQPDFNLQVDTLKTILSSNIREVLGAQNFSVLLSAKRTALLRRIRDRMNNDCRQLGVQVADVRIRRVGLPQENAEAIYQRMKKDLERQAIENRAEGDRMAQEIHARADREVAEIHAEAQSQAMILRGEGEAAKTRIIGAVAGQDPQFYAFWRSLQAYQETLSGSTTTVILSPRSDFLRYFGEGPGGRGR